MQIPKPGKHVVAAVVPLRQDCKILLNKIGAQSRCLFRHRHIEAAHTHIQHYCIIVVDLLARCCIQTAAGLATKISASEAAWYRRRLQVPLSWCDEETIVRLHVDACDWECAAWPAVGLQGFLSNRSI